MTFALLNGANYTYTTPMNVCYFVLCETKENISCDAITTSKQKKKKKSVLAHTHRR